MVQERITTVSMETQNIELESWEISEVNSV